MSVTYEQALVSIPTGAGRSESGIITPLIRISTHIGYLIAHIADRTGTEATEEAKAEFDAHDYEELGDITNHCITFNTSSNTVSNAANSHLANLIGLIARIGEGWAELDDERRRERLSDVSNRIAWIAAFLDTELAAIRAVPAATL